MTRRNGLTYKDAGVDIEAGDDLVQRIKPFAKATARPGADASLGGFGALFDLKAAGFTDPILVASTDGVGTKLKIAAETGHLSTIGIDLVAMCANDVVCQGGQPLFFLDYFATGKLDVERAAAIVAGIAAGCRDADCALIGGETAEMPGLYATGDFDLAGFVVGAMERGTALPDQDAMAPGDVLIGVESSGAHSNGYSLIRRIVAGTRLNWEAGAPYAPGLSLADTLLTPTRIYVREALAARGPGLKGFAHITGGGLTENVPRILPDGLSARIDLGAWAMPPLFAWLQHEGGVETAEMLRAFNCGIGLVAVAAPEAAERVIAAFHGRARVIGTLIAADGPPATRFEGALSPA